MAGSIAETIYPIPQSFRGMILDRMDPFLLHTIVEAVDFLSARERQNRL